MKGFGGVGYHHFGVLKPHGEIAYVGQTLYRSALHVCIVIRVCIVVNVGIVAYVC